ncbi:MAG: tRNA uridine-5-carboxymethylaminomethyl(34) synthesis GTPase MnmE [Eubacterium sp.]|nr:tRNA uridine-5-carboxymethylaminomethyl(34) synthesis GTPase MnmE [Eubacterium sp.]
MSIYKSDTICGVATGLGRSAIGMIRVSGPDAIKICDRIFVGKKRISEMDSFMAAFGRIVENSINQESRDDSNFEIIDEAVVLVMKAPHTYTTEDTVEIDIHGGNYVVKRVMDLLVSQGVRVADPGEFTKRAFLGGRIDMAEAEAVMDVINAETEMALKSSISQLSGKLSREVSELREKLLYSTAYIESALDDPENYSLDGFDEKLSQDLDNVLARIEKLLSTADEGRIVREGISTAIVGRPNVGKSSVLNMLLGEERAIVTDIEGTTRDTLEEYVNIGGILLKLIDTAGIRETTDVVERIGVDKARGSIDDADLVMLILDSSEDITENDMEIISSLADKNKKVITLLNKSDKNQVLDREKLNSIVRNISNGQAGHKDNGLDMNIIEISAKTGSGLDTLRDKVSELFFSDEITFNNQVHITNSRQKSALIAARDSLERVQQSIADGMGEDFYTIDLMAAYEALGEIIGETLEDDLADKIFSEFCMGK